MWAWVKGKLAAGVLGTGLVAASYELIGQSEARQTMEREKLEMRAMQYTELMTGNNAEHIGRMYNKMDRIETKIDSYDQKQTERFDRLMFELKNQRR